MKHKTCNRKKKETYKKWLTRTLKYITFFFLDTYITLCLINSKLKLHTHTHIIQAIEVHIISINISLQKKNMFCITYFICLHQLLTNSRTRRWKNPKIWSKNYLIFQHESLIQLSNTLQQRKSLLITFYSMLTIGSHANRKSPNLLFNRQKSGGWKRVKT